MPTLDISIDGKITKIEYDEKLAKGIYVAQKRKAYQNCKTLKIDFDETLPDNILQNRHTIIKTLGILTLHVSGEIPDGYLQYILFKTTDKIDVEDLAKEVPKETGDNIRLVYGLLHKFTNLGGFQ